jgi:hypothetical protein
VLCGRPGATIPPRQPIRHGRLYGDVMTWMGVWPHSAMPQADAGRAPMSKVPMSGGLGRGVPARERHERFDRQGLARHHSRDTGRAPTGPAHRPRLAEEVWPTPVQPWF